MDRKEFLLQIEAVRGKDAKAFCDLVTRMDFSLLTKEDFSLLVHGHFGYEGPHASWGNLDNKNYDLRLYRPDYNTKYFFTLLKRARAQKDTTLFETLIGEFFGPYGSYKWSKDEDCQPIVDAFLNEIKDSSESYNTKVFRNKITLLKFRCDLDKIKNLDETKFHSLLEEMDFSLLENGNHGDMQEIEVNHFGSASQHYDVEESRSFYKEKLHRVGKQTWKEYLDSFRQQVKSDK